jgi:hypothetical protein
MARYGIERSIASSLRAIVDDGVTWVLRDAGSILAGFDATITSDVPPGTGSATC